MNSALIVFWIIFVILILQNRSRCLEFIRKHIRSKKGKFKMTEIINNFIGKECLIYTCTSAQITGVIRSCNDGWLQVEKNGVCELVNCEYIIRVREYPRNKNGKKKSVVLD